MEIRPKLQHTEIRPKLQHMDMEAKTIMVTKVPSASLFSLFFFFFFASVYRSSFAFCFIARTLNRTDVQLGMATLMRTSNMVLSLEVSDVLSAHLICSYFQAVKYIIRLFLLYCGHLYDNSLLIYVGPNPNQQQYSTEDYYKVYDDNIVFFH